MDQHVGNRLATALGLIAIVLWGTSVALSRSLAESLGVYTTACWIYLGSGAIGCLYVCMQRERRRRLARIPWAYWVGCGSTFVIYIVCFHLAVGLASDRRQVVEVGLINYLWISLALVFSVPLLGKRARLGLVPGVIVACAGIALLAFASGSLSWETLGQSLHNGGWTAGSRLRDGGLLPDNALPYALALLAAVSWGLYSNLSRRWSGRTDSGGVPVFLLASGLVLLALRCFVTEETLWSPRAVAELAYTVLFPTLLAYAFWDLAMRKGAMVLVVSASYLIPLMSTAITCLYLHVTPGLALWIACILVMAGAVLCKRSIID